MFETAQEVKPNASTGLWIGIAVVMLIIAGAVFFLVSKGGANKGGASMLGSAALAKSHADPVHDLRIQRATMAKDRNGAMSVWSVSIENKSNAYAYSKIKYETTYIGANGQVLMTNNGTLGEAIAPGEERSYQANDPLYPSATASYNFKITSASSVVQQ